MNLKIYKDIQKTLSDLDGKYIENNMLKSLDISITAHFGNSVTCEMHFENCCLFAVYSLNYLTPDVLKVIIECLDLSEEDGLRISNIKNVPVRIVCNSACGKVIGFGHFMKDRFILAEDIIEMAKENMKIRYREKTNEGRKLKELYSLLSDINPVEIDSHLEDDSLFSWLGAWRGEAERILKQDFEVQEEK